jgi:hypothetical protein
MTWHKNGKRYNPDKMVHASDGEAWKHFDAIHREKAEEARFAECHIKHLAKNLTWGPAHGFFAKCWPADTRQKVTPLPSVLGDTRQR